MAWQRGATRARTPEWKALVRQARRELPLMCQATGRTEAQVKADGERLELDHIIPVAEGGTNTIGNLQWLSSSAHQAKTKAEWRRAMQRRRARRHLPAKKHPGAA